jgi:excisionase family DNA binding protein
MSMPEDPLLLTKTEAAALLSCSVRTVERLIESGDLSYVLVGSRQAIDLEDIRAFIGANKKTRGVVRPVTGSAALIL